MICWPGSTKNSSQAPRTGNVKRVHSHLRNDLSLAKESPTQFPLEEAKNNIKTELRKTYWMKKKKKNRYSFCPCMDFINWKIKEWKGQTASVSRWRRRQQKETSSTMVKRKSSKWKMDWLTDSIYSFSYFIQLYRNTKTNINWKFFGLYFVIVDLFVWFGSVGWYFFGLIRAWLFGLLFSFERSFYFSNFFVFTDNSWPCIALSVGLFIYLIN